AARLPRRSARSSARRARARSTRRQRAARANRAPSARKSSRTRRARSEIEPACRRARAAEVEIWILRERERRRCGYVGRFGDELEIEEVGVVAFAVVIGMRWRIAPEPAGGDAGVDERVEIRACKQTRLDLLRRQPAERARLRGCEVVDARIRIEGSPRRVRPGERVEIDHADG